MHKEGEVGKRHERNQSTVLIACGNFASGPWIGPPYNEAISLLLTETCFARDYYGQKYD